MYKLTLSLLCVCTHMTYNFNQNHNWRIGSWFANGLRNALPVPELCVDHIEWLYEHGTNQEFSRLECVLSETVWKISFKNSEVYHWLLEF